MWNAGIQRSVDLTAGVVGEWIDYEAEISTNLSRAKNPVISTVTSGLSFVPLANVAIYASTKAALHSFTLRHQLKSTGLKVLEIIPPAVDTDLQAPGLHKFGVNVDVFADAVFEKILKGEEEIAYRMAEKGRSGFRNAVEEIFEAMNK